MNKKISIRAKRLQFEPALEWELRGPGLQYERERLTRSDDDLTSMPPIQLRRELQIELDEWENSRPPKSSSVLLQEILDEEAEQLAHEMKLDSLLTCVNVAVKKVDQQIEARIRKIQDDWRAPQIESAKAFQEKSAYELRRKRLRAMNKDCQP